MSEPIRILHVLGGLNLGGAESRIMDLYRGLDREKLQFDFLVHADQAQHFDDEIEQMGGRIYRVPRFVVYNWFSYRRALKKFFSAHREFRAVHGHMTSTASIYLPIAKKAGVPITIAHARSAGVPGGLKGVLTKMLRRSLKRRADHCLACSGEAAKAVFGRKWVQKGRVEIIPNVIETSKFVYNEEIRERVRSEMKLDGRLVIGHVGSFREAKNHKFLLEVFAQIRKEREDAVLLLLGEGELMERVKEQAGMLGLDAHVLFLGNKADVSDYYQAFDYLLFPSLYEGMPGTVVEAQAAGLRCLISENITREVKVTDLVTFMSLDRPAGEWARFLLSDCGYERKDHAVQVKEAGFDAHAQIERYERLYRKNLLLMVPLLHQGGFERICVMTGRLLSDTCNVTLEIFSSCDRFYDVSGMDLVDLDLGSRPGKLGKAVNVLKRVRATKKIKKQKNIHITYSFGPTACLVNAFSRVRDDIWIGIRGYDAVENRNMLRLQGGRADKILCCARVMADDIRGGFGFKHVEYLYNPCDVEGIAAKSLEEVPEEHRAFMCGTGPVLATVSREDDVKGIWHLIKAFALIVREIPDARLVIIGDGEYEEYKKLADDLKVREKVLFTGVRKNPFSYLRESSLFVMTSITEGFPNALVEAMAVGVPVMSANCKTGPAEILAEDYKEAEDAHRVHYGEYGILLPVISPEKNMDASVTEEEERILAAEAVKLLRDDERREQLAKAAKRRSREFSVEKYAEGLKSMV